MHSINRLLNNKMQTAHHLQTYTVINDEAILSTTKSRAFVELLLPFRRQLSDCFGFLHLVRYSYFYNAILQGQTTPFTLFNLNFQNKMSTTHRFVMQHQEMPCVNNIIADICSYITSRNSYYCNTKKKGQSL